jgi:hypothetical protein
MTESKFSPVRSSFLLLAAQAMALPPRDEFSISAPTATGRPLLEGLARAMQGLAAPPLIEHYQVTRNTPRTFALR